MMKPAIGDLMHVYSSFGSGVDYTCRLITRMKDPVDGSALETALRNTEKRYPYFSVRMRRNEFEYYYDENPSPVVLLNTDQKITLNSPQTNYHVWAVCYMEDRIYLDFYHGITDGAGMYMVLATLLYYYCQGRYGVTEHEGIHTLDDPITPAETRDPLASLPQLDPDTLSQAVPPEAFSIIHHGGAAPIKPVIYDIDLPAHAFMRFTSDSDASPGTLISLLLLRALDARYPDRDLPLVGNYVVNARTRIHEESTSHNCISSLKFFYRDKLRQLPFSVQTTAFRGITFLGGDEDAIRRKMTLFAASNRWVMAQKPLLEDKKAAFAWMRSGYINAYSSIVSYIGKWKYPATGQYVRESWVHAPSCNNCFGELSAIGDRIGLSLHMCSEHKDLLDLFFAQFEEHKIPYEIRSISANDVAAFPEPI